MKTTIAIPIIRIVEEILVLLCNLLIHFNIQYFYIKNERHMARKLCDFCYK